MDKTRVAKLIRLLASDIDGEALGAARALRKIVNLNDLGNLIEYGEKPKPKPRDEIDGLSDEEIVEFCFSWIDRLSGRSHGFIEGLPDRLERYGKLTPAQRQWAVDIYKQLNGMY